MVFAADVHLLLKTGNSHFLLFNKSSRVILNYRTWFVLLINYILFLIGFIYAIFIFENLNKKLIKKLFLN